MKISAITFYKHQYKFNDNKTQQAENSPKYIQTNELPAYYPISFSGIANSGKLRSLFSYGLPCMYSGVKTIDPKQILRLANSNAFCGSSTESVKIIERFEESLTGIEAKVFNIIKENSKLYPDKNLQEILQKVAPVFKKRLRKKQEPIFDELNKASYAMPDKYRYKFKQFMDETHLQLDDKPIILPFSTKEFKYKLLKINEDLKDIDNTKATRVMKKLLIEANRLPLKSSAKTNETQKEILAFMNKIFKNSILKKNEQLQNLFDTSFNKLNKKEAIIPFSRKAFIYDLSKLIQEVPVNLQEKMITIAQKLPTSRESVSAYILKSISQPPEKIGYRLLWPSAATVEHILPRSCGGPDLMYNFGVASSRENSDRQNIDFVKQLRRRPQARENCQKLVDKLISLSNWGVFDHNHIKKTYISDFANTIKKQSKGSLTLDTSKLE